LLVATTTTLAVIPSLTPPERVTPSTYSGEA